MTREEWAAYWGRYVRVDADYLAKKAGDMVRDAERSPDLFDDTTRSHLRMAHQALGEALRLTEPMQEAAE